MSATKSPRGRRVVIVGGGIAGLTAARAVLIEDPTCAVDVIEAGDRVGGKVRQEVVAGRHVDVGAEAMLATRPEALDLLSALTSPDEIVTPTTTSAQIWTRGSLHPLPRTRVGVPFADSAVTGLLTAAEEARMRDEQPTPPVAADQSVGDFVERRLGGGVVDRLVEPLLGGVYAGRVRELSLQATMPQVWARAAAGEALLEPAPSAAGVGARPPFVGLIGGVGRLATLLADDILARGGTIETRTIVRGVSRDPEGWSVLTGPTTSPQTRLADAVIVAVPAPAAAKLLSDDVPVASAELGQVETASVAVITLAVPAAQVVSWPGSGFLVPSVDGRLIKASTFSSAKWGWLAREGDGTAYVRASIGRAGESAALQRADAELVSLAAEEIAAAMASGPLTVIDSHVQRWGGGLPQYAVGHVDRVRRIEQAIGDVPGLELAGATYAGVGIPAVISTGTAAAARTLTHLRDHVPARRQ